MSYYNDIFSVNNTDDNEKQIVIPNRTGSPLLAKQKSLTMRGFIDFAARRNYNIARSIGLNKQQALKATRYMTTQQALESQYGNSYAARNKYNRSGMMLNGKTINYATPDLNDIALYKSFIHNPNWKQALYAPDMEGYIYKLQDRSNGKHPYEGTKSAEQYYRDMKGLKTFQKELDSYFNSGVTNSWTMNHNMIGLEDMIPLA